MRGHTAHTKPTRSLRFIDAAWSPTDKLTWPLNVNQGTQYKFIGDVVCSRFASPFAVSQVFRSLVPGKRDRPQVVKLSMSCSLKTHILIYSTIWKCCRGTSHMHRICVPNSIANSVHTGYSKTKPAAIILLCHDWWFYSLYAIVLHSHVVDNFQWQTT